VEGGADGLQGAHGGGGEGGRSRIAQASWRRFSHRNPDIVTRFVRGYYK